MGTTYTQLSLHTILGTQIGIFYLRPSNATDNKSIHSLHICVVVSRVPYQAMIVSPNNIGIQCLPLSGRCLEGLFFKVQRF